MLKTPKPYPPNSSISGSCDFLNGFEGSEGSLRPKSSTACLAGCRSAMKCLGITTTRRREKRVGSDRFHGAPVDGLQGALLDGVGPRLEQRSDHLQETSGNHGLKTSKNHEMWRFLLIFPKYFMKINASIKHPETTCEIWWDGDLPHALEEMWSSYQVKARLFFVRHLAELCWVTKWIRIVCKVQEPSNQSSGLW